jgi:hypothetical protein
MNGRQYSVHTAEELEAAKAARAAPMLKQFHRDRVELQARAVSVMADNVRYRLSEISDLMDDVDERAGFRALLETLRHVEVELEAAVGKLAAELGMVAC